MLRGLVVRGLVVRDPNAKAKLPFASLLMDLNTRSLRKIINVPMPLMVLCINVSSEAEKTNFEFSLHAQFRVAIIIEKADCSFKGIESLDASTSIIHEAKYSHYMWWLRDH